MDNNYSDEVSLRDLYLIFRQGFVLIVVVALLAGAAAFLYASIQPDRFEAQATVLVTPTPERRVDDAGSAIIQRTNVNYATYESLAFSQRVLDRTARAAGIPADELENFTERLELSNLVDGQSGSSQLIIGHSAAADSATEAAEIANIWSRTTIEAVTNTMQAILEPIVENNTATVDELAGNLAALEEEWRVFQDRNHAALLEAELASFTSRNTAAGERLDSIERDLAANRARQQALAEALSAVGAQLGSAIEADGDTMAELLESRSLLTPQAAAELRAFMQTAGTDVQLVQLLLGLELQALLGEAAALNANREATISQQAEYAAAAAERRAEIAALTQERTELERRLRIAENVYTNALDLEPILSYVSDVLASNVRMLDEAAEPVQPASGGRLLITVIAAVVGGLLATVFVFLRAAVMPEPEEARPPRGRVQSENAAV